MKAKIKRHKVLIIVLSVIAVAAITGSILFINLRPSANDDTGKQKENVITLGKQNLTKSISATGTIESSNSKTVSAKVSSLTVKKVKVKVGDQVQKGDTLITFDKSDLKDTLTDARENLATVKTDASRSISSATQQLSNAQATYSNEISKAAKNVSNAKETLSKAEKEVTSLKNKLKSTKKADEKKQLREQITKAEEVVSQAKTNYDNAVSNQESSALQSKNSVRNAEDSLANANSSTQKSIKEAQKQVENAKKALKDCAVTAPISGIITVVNVTEGDIYSGGSLFQIDDTSSFTVTTSVDEYDISDVSVGQHAVILTEATDKEEIQGTISFVAPSTSSTSSASASSTGNSTAMGNSSSSSDGYEVVIDITDENDKLRMGLTAKCSLILEEANDVFAVPYDAIHKNNNRDDVIYITEDENNTANYKEIPVTKGLESDYYVEISGDALTEGMLVIIPTDETEEPSEKNNSVPSEFGFGGGNMPGHGNMQGGENGGQSFRRQNGGGNGNGNPPAVPGGN